MIDFDRDRIALVVAEPALQGPESAAAECVGTGYFLTEDMVLTVRHIAAGTNSNFSVRAEVGGPEESDRWSTATAEWMGTGDVDAMLLRTAKPFGSWQLPSFTAAPAPGRWRSAGYARAAADEKHNNRKTLPLTGSLDLSLGQGAAELALRTDENIAEAWDTYWRGISGAPVFADDPGGDAVLAGIVTDANRALSNGLFGLPAARLLDDIGFRSAIAPSFLPPLPATPFCVVMTSEGGDSDLVGQTGDVLAACAETWRLGELYDKPIHLPVAEAVSSVENWAATIDVLARADYLIADITCFEPAIMMLLGIRSVLRRGVTINVSHDESATMPFNIYESKVLRCDDKNFFESLPIAMAEGIAHLGSDGDYLDLPTYQAVRTPRPEGWAAKDSTSIVMLCSFNTDYSKFFEQRLEPIIRGHTKNKDLFRTIKDRSPRLVGQALYQRIRWSSWCLVDWTGWSPNVFFELGVRIACAERDPLCIIQEDDGIAAADDATGQPPRTLRQHEFLRRLFNPVTYGKTDPRHALVGPLESWPKPPTLGNGRERSAISLPTAGTFMQAQRSFCWQQDTTLTPPHIEQRHAAERVFGQDPEKQAERLTLFAGNEQFDAALQDAVREKWVAAWLYLRHLDGEHDSAGQRADLAAFARLTEYALRPSTNPRHIRLREEITNFLRDQKTHRRARESEGGDG